MPAKKKVAKTQTHKTHKPVILIIRDGWGYRKEKDMNATILGDVPYTNYLMKTYPNTIIKTSGEDVGLPAGYQGNSEVGHMTIGSGRIIYQSMEKINHSIKNGEFFKNKALLNAIENCKNNNSALHLIGLLQQEGVHAHIDHCIATLELCKKQNFKNVLVHVISDGRDASPTGTVNNVKILLAKFKELGFGKIATVSGRFYTMDRDKRWDRTKKAYDCIISGVADGLFEDPVKLFEECYAKNETDEFIVPRKASFYNGIKDNDSFFFYNFRTDRTRQLTRAMIEEEFEGWNRKPLKIRFVAMTDFYTPMDKRAEVAFPPESLSNLLGKIIADAGLKQLRISETEKYAHVTFFFNGQIEEPNKNEDRILIQSPKVATYDLKPEMSVKEIADRLCQEIDKEIYDFIVVNFVNGDMVGHTGIWPAIMTAVHAVDECLKKVVEKTLEKNGVALVFADHGNCEDKTEMWKTSHTINPVPLIVVSNDEKLKKAKLKEGKGLQDIAPTVLKLLSVQKPKEMTGESII